MADSVTGQAWLRVEVDGALAILKCRQTPDVWKLFKVVSLKCLKEPWKLHIIWQRHFIYFQCYMMVVPSSILITVWFQYFVKKKPTQSLCMSSLIADEGMRRSAGADLVQAGRLAMHLSLQPQHCNISVTSHSRPPVFSSSPVHSHSASRLSVEWSSEGEPLGPRNQHFPSMSQPLIPSPWSWSRKPERGGRMDSCRMEACWVRFAPRLGCPGQRPLSVCL